jgi:hypothetical protein
MGESACWDWNGEEWRSHLSMLVLLAVAAHSCHVFAHPHPSMSSYLSSGGTCARMGHTVDDVEDGNPITDWHKWLGDAMCHITKQAGPLYLDSPHCQGRGLRGLQRASTAGLVGHQRLLEG